MCQCWSRFLKCLYTMFNRRRKNWLMLTVTLYFGNVWSELISTVPLITLGCCTTSDGQGHQNFVNDNQSNSWLYPEYFVRNFYPLWLWKSLIIWPSDTVLHDYHSYYSRLHKSCRQEGNLNQVCLRQIYTNQKAALSCVDQSEQPQLAQHTLDL